jgi:hypothetical protein
LANLPPMLVDLELREMSPSARISVDGVGLLPPSLESLTIDQTGTLTDETIRHLPPNLTRLTLTSEGSHELSDACVPYLSRRLTILRLSDCPNITQAAIKHFPRTLTDLSIVWEARFKDACDHFPPFMRPPGFTDGETFLNDQHPTRQSFY